MKKTLLGLSRGELSTVLNQGGFAAYRAEQVAHWIYQKNTQNIFHMLNISLKLRDYLGQYYETSPAKRHNYLVSKDGTLKLLIKLQDDAYVETVGMPYARRFSCCVSTQVGCPIGCIFCATGQSGFRRNLSPGEIVAQISLLGSILDARNSSAKKDRNIDNIVFMGMGEPLLNYAATLKAINLIRDEIGLSARNITLSTVGHIPGMIKLMRENLQITLAVSLHASSDVVRNYLIPSMKHIRISRIINTCTEYFAHTGRRITFEYCLIGGVNDHAEDARRLAVLLRDLTCNVNLIPYNKTFSAEFKTPAVKTVDAFQNILNNEGINVT
ncbi:MAG TPA: 23S rRNA (adenine(2503)-C(2))-methyltransferase RlmN, partial [Dehalococcoidia bacterium]|nr:23S rRNA (adenine(2503)-C(2))-methyltransferase RlmN [Dehalococcoidia bacterium]